MWWQWQIVMANGSTFINGSSFSSPTYALDAAMSVAILKKNPVVIIKIYPSSS